MPKSAQITDKAAKAISEGETYSEKIGGRGAGVLLLVGRRNCISAYYRYTDPAGKRPWIELGAISKELSLTAAREKCSVLNVDRKAHPYLKEWLESEAALQKLAHDATKAATERATRLATLQDLLNDYTANLKVLGRASAQSVEKMFAKVVFEDSARVAALKAKDVTADDILEVLRPLSARGAKVYRNRLRSYLHAAFQFGLKAEYDETRTSAKSFGIKQNPVAAIPALQGVEQAGTRALTDEELKQFYTHVGDVTDVGPIVANVFRFLIALAGQRPMQVLAVPRTGYDFENGTMHIIDRKGRGSKPRVHLVPLTDRAREILDAVAPLTSAYNWPFTTLGLVPVSTQSLKNAIKRFRESEFGKIDGKQIPHFTSKDLRRTCKQLMVRTGIRRDLRNLLQNHGQTGVDVTAYANDPAAHLPEKRRAMIQYEEALAAVLSGKKSKKVVPIKKQRKEM